MSLVWRVEGNVVGLLPRQHLLENVDALARGEATVPHAGVVGQYSSPESRKVHQVVDPRSHIVLWIHFHEYHG
ncbi:UNVERIFIED_CONTAM: Thioredoxin-like protein, chloroplastic [Sesamum indicum]